MSRKQYILTVIGVVIVGVSSSCSNETSGKKKEKEKTTESEMVDCSLLQELSTASNDSLEAKPNN